MNKNVKIFGGGCTFREYSNRTFPCERGCGLLTKIASNGGLWR